MYCLFEEQLQTEEGEVATSFGITYEGSVAVKISNVCIKRERLEEFIARINAYQLSPMHLDDAIEDWLVG